jgi:hypothetical protein
MILATMLRIARWALHHHSNLQKLQMKKHGELILSHKPCFARPMKRIAKQSSEGNGTWQRK